ncbi:MAG: phosphoserine phosphatase SerB [Rhodospirillaceae bacterium]|nr:phosphoserine phosphatase SerB [Rhodospirillaceae bacterium]
MQRMKIVITIIANPKIFPLTKLRAKQLSEEFGSEPPRWLAKEIACELRLENELNTVRKAAATSSFKSMFDIIVQPMHGRRKKLLLTDMDSTIVKNETLDELANLTGFGKQISAITDRAMKGELDFKTALIERVKMLQGVPEQALHDTWAKIELMQGARELVSTMKANGATCILISGGFKFFTDRLSELLKFDRNFANTLLLENGILTGAINEPILDKNSKRSALFQLIKTYNLDQSETIAVGDGANDLPMILSAGMGVAFHAKPILEKKAPACIRFGDLTAVLYIQGYKKADFKNSNNS